VKNLSLYILLSFIFTGCSFDTPPNDWQYKSINAFDSYTKNFLRSNEEMAKNDIQRAVSHAKNSADLKPLARIYLGECALNISVGIDNKCQKYNNIKELINSKKLNAYYHLLNSTITEDEIKDLPQTYQKFASHLQTKDYQQANNDISDIKKATSQLIASSLLKDKLNKQNIKRIIKVSSFYGYKKAVLYWLIKLKEKTSNINEKLTIDKKISILKN